ncbi:MAG: SMP-30/gluconolactonase/LRE family protein [Calditrichaceae bacterium]|nr:SMP-30/gluconolactonase/LRE family protein [Calditrichaceae bacterium]MBN2710723.1 SMP-30/gluconolactonase/LRE family protein [Calditrichaceae bacterium]
MKSIILNIVLLLSYSGVICSQNYNMPESAVYDPSQKRYFISNFGSGCLMQIDSCGTITTFKSDLSKPLGMVLCGDILYVVENPNKISGFNITTGRQTKQVIIDSALFLNDITSDSNGDLYVTDSRRKSIYKIEPGSMTCYLFTHTIFSDPNGIAYDKINNRLIVCFFCENAPVQAVNLKDSSVTTMVSPSLHNLDGIAIDSDGNAYISCWGKGSFAKGFPSKGMIYKFNPSFTNPPEIIELEHFGPADIFFNPKNNLLVIPYLLDNIVEFRKIR